MASFLQAVRDLCSTGHPTRTRVSLLIDGEAATVFGDEPPGSLLSSILKAGVVAVLAACFERSSTLAAWLNRSVLWAWPGMRRA